MTDADYDAYRASLSMLRYSALPVLRKLPGERVPEWSCTCPGLKPWKRHKQPWECIPQHEVDAWRQTSGCGPKTAREWLWMEREFRRSNT